MLAVWRILRVLKTHALMLQSPSVRHFRCLVLAFEQGRLLSDSLSGASQQRSLMLLLGSSFCMYAPSRYAQEARAKQRPAAGPNFFCAFMDARDASKAPTLVQHKQGDRPRKKEGRGAA